MELLESKDGDPNPFCRYTGTFRTTPAIVIVPEDPTDETSVALLGKERDAYKLVRQLSVKT